MPENNPLSLFEITEARSLQRRSGWASVSLLGAGLVDICAGVQHNDTALGLVGLALVTGAGMAFAVCDEVTAQTDRQVEQDLSEITTTWQREADLLQ